jgi:cell division protein ZapA
MSTVNVEVNGRQYAVGCEDGQEAHVQSLARLFDAQVQDVAAQVGQVGELRLFLMAALLTADELADARARLNEAVSRVADVEAEAAALIERVAERIEGIARE